jgi:hypothetical protein
MDGGNQNRRWRARGARGEDWGGVWPGARKGIERECACLAPDVRAKMPKMPNEISRMPVKTVDWLSMLREVRCECVPRRQKSEGEGKAEVLRGILTPTTAHSIPHNICLVCAHSPLNSVPLLIKAHKCVCAHCALELALVPLGERSCLSRVRPHTCLCALADLRACLALCTLHAPPSPRLTLQKRMPITAAEGVAWAHKHLATSEVVFRTHAFEK